MIAAGLLPLMSKSFEKTPKGADIGAATAADFKSVRDLAAKLPNPWLELLAEQRAAFDRTSRRDEAPEQAAESGDEIAVLRAPEAWEEPQAQWRHMKVPSERMSERIQEFEASASDPDPEKRGFVLAPEQKAMCKWFGVALDMRSTRKQDLYL